MKTYRTLLLAGMLAAGLNLTHPLALAAQRTLVMERFDTELQVEPDGDVQVTETLLLRFRGSWNGIYRNLSLEHKTAQERRERLDVAGNRRCAQQRDQRLLLSAGDGCHVHGRA